jgi:GNAT superfamily N-acetyltransferase
MATTVDSYHFEELSRQNHEKVRSLILDGLSDHWGATDEALNPDLEDMLTSYAHGRTLVVRDSDARLCGTGTVVPRDGRRAEILRMSVDVGSRGQGLGRRIVDELVTTARRWGCEAVVLETSTSWTDVVRFYMRCGFSITHIVDGEFGSDTWFERNLDDGLACGGL